MDFDRILFFFRLCLFINTPLHVRCSIFVHYAYLSFRLNGTKTRIYSRFMRHINISTSYFHPVHKAFRFLFVESMLSNCTCVCVCAKRKWIRLHFNLRSDGEWYRYQCFPHANIIISFCLQSFVFYFHFSSIFPMNVYAVAGVTIAVVTRPFPLRIWLSSIELCDVIWFEIEVCIRSIFFFFSFLLLVALRGLGKSFFILGFFSPSLHFLQYTFVVCLNCRVSPFLSSIDRQ